VTDPATLKRISKAAIPEALAKAERYRLLNEPNQAESICLDILEADPDDQEALVMLILAMTDQFGTERSPGVRDVRAYVARLTDEYQRAYYGGLVWERQAGVYLRRGKARSSAYGAFRDAMALYEQAEAIRPEGDDSVILRWNACVRSLAREGLGPPPREAEQPLE
jgi:tetratricopeptide (TPR) repeat protein